MAGSLLMLVAIDRVGLSAGTFDMTQLGDERTSVWIFLGFAAAFAVKAPLWPFHGWLPDAYRESPAEVAALLSGVISKTAAYGFLAHRAAVLPRRRSRTGATPVLVLASIGLVYGSLLAFRAPDVRGVIAYSSLAQMCLIVIGLFAVNDSGLDRRAPPDGQPRAHLGRALPPRRARSSGGPARASSAASAAWRAGGRVLATRPHHDRRDRARGARARARSPASS